MMVGAAACARQAHARGNRVTCGGAGWWVAVLSLPRVGVGGAGYFDAGVEESGTVWKEGGCMSAHGRTARSGREEGRLASGGA